MVVSQWGETGKELFEPSWSPTLVGSSVDVVVHIICVGTDSSLAKLVASGSPCRLIGSLPASCASSYLTVFAAQVLDVTPGVQVDLQLTVDSSFRAHPPATLDSLLRVVEFCSGIGASSIGLKKAGFVPVCGVEWQPAIASLFSKLHCDIPMIEGDICDPTTLQAVSQKVEGPFTLMAGISCQPYSRAGAQAGGADQRASTLPATCRACYILGVPLLIIECVAPARENVWVRKHLLALQQILGYQINEVELKLEDVWGGNRHRWWMVASHPSLGISELHTFSQSSHLVVRDLMPYVRNLEELDLSQLELTADEIQTFMELAHGHMRKYCVRMDMKLPTALHSWGQQTSSCACGCRIGGFSRGLLLERGLFAQILPIGFSADNKPRWRHLHATEVALLSGMPPIQNWGEDARLNLCAVGQLASPMHSVWIGAQLHRQLQVQLGLDVTVDPNTCLMELKQEIMEQVKSLYPTIQATPLSSVVKVFTEDEPTGFALTVSVRATVAQLLEAEAGLDQSLADGWHVIDTSENIPLDRESLLAGRTVKIVKQSIAPLEPPSFPGSLAENGEAPKEPEIADLDSLGLRDASGPPVEAAVKQPQAISSLVPSALLTLPAKQLAALVPPQVQDPALMMAMREQSMSIQDRMTILDHQGSVWGDDELFWHLNRCSSSSVARQVSVLDPLLATGWVMSPVTNHIQAVISSFPQFEYLATCVLIHHHWIPVVWQVKEKELHAHMWDHLDFDPNCLEPLHHAVCQAVGVSSVQVSFQTRDFAPYHLCGAAAIAFIEHFVCQGILPHKVSHLQAFHDQCRKQFEVMVKQRKLVNRPWCWGNGQFDLNGTLASLLVSHGVPNSVAPSRASLLIQSLGSDPVTQALQGSSPWKSLKAVANLHTPVIQLVLPDEQLAHQTKRSDQQPKQKKNKKHPSVPAVLKPADLDPTKLVLAEGSFCVQGDKPVPQIALSQVGPLSSGVALTTLAAAHSFLKSGTLLTHQGLALLILNATDEPVTSLQWASVRFAAKCSLNHEPMLLTGFLVQLGKETIYLYRNKAGTPLMQVEVACARITVYRDQWIGSWEDFHAKPVKSCLALIPALHSCLNKDCHCEKWHPGEESLVHDAVLDVFRRQFFTEAGRPVDWTNANYFAFNVRFVLQQESGVLAASGQRGIYIEPKTDDAGGPSLKYQVVWLPQLTFEEVTHRAQCEALSLGVARSGRRYGVRVSAEHFQHVFQTLKPDGLYLPPGNRSTWHCGPWPFGVDRKSIAAVFKQWKWAARPLQPVHSVQGGMMWLIQAVAEPPAVVFHMQHGQVVVSRCKQSEDPTVAAEVIGQTQTVKLCTSQKSDDPWVVKDPWQAYVPSSATAVPAQPPKVQLEQMEARLEKAILAKLPATPMEQDDQHDRITVLEQQVAQLAGRQQSLEDAVQDHHTQSAAQVQQLQAQMSAQMDLQGKQMKSMLDDQMSKLEAILSKRSRHEWQIGSLSDFGISKPQVRRSAKHANHSGLSFRPSAWLRIWSSFVMLLSFGNFRIGEASVPGPHSDPEDRWSIGVCNPSGLMGKGHIASQIPADVIAVSETHLTSVSRSSFLCSLKASEPSFQRLITGAPMAPRSEVSEAGDWAGVAFLSKYPCRASQVVWPQDLFETGRIQFSTSFVDPFWLTGGVVYGYPPGVTHPFAHEQTMGILSFAVSFITQSCVGPRFLGGDWNFEPHMVSVWDDLQSQGWIEVQDLWERQAGLSPQMTCKFKTRKDFLWLSPELARHFVGLQILDLFADHCVLCADFSSPKVLANRWLWTKPCPIDWQGIPDIPHVVDFTNSDPSDAYHALWTFRESQAKQHLGQTWHSHMAGRAAQRQPKHRRGWPTPLKKGRSHDVQPQFHGVSVQHARWFKQLRRLQSYLRWACSPKVCLGGPSDQGISLWQSILEASGFAPNFSCWWTSRVYRCPGDIPSIPVYPLNPEVALQIYHSLLAETRALEQKLLQARQAVAKHKREVDPNVIFKDVRRPVALPVETLVANSTSRVTAIDLEDSALEIDPPCLFNRELPLQVAGQPVQIHHAEPDKVWVDQLPTVDLGATIVQTNYLGSLPDLFDAFHVQWKRRWCKHDQIPNSQWQDIVDFASQAFPPQKAPVLTLDVPLLRAEAHRKKKTAATGLDGASRLDFITGGDNFFRSLLSMYHRACSDGSWPCQIMAGSVASLAKTPSAATVNEYRPITSFGFAYRCWASLHARHLLDWADSWAHPDIHGNRRYHQAAHLWTCIVHQIEEAYTSGRPLSGLTADIEKAYNCLPRWPVFCAALYAGTDPLVLTGWAGAVASMQRHFKIRDSYSSGFATSTGLAEGCALSCYGMLLLDHLLHIWLRAQSPAVRCLSYVDNWDLLTWDPEWACQQLDLVVAFATKLDLTVDKQKTFGWSTNAAVRASMRAVGIRTQHAARDLGAHVAYTKQHTNAALQERVSALDSFWSQLRRSSSPYKVKVRALRTVAWKRGLHAVSSVPLGKSFWSVVRSKATQALWGRRAGVNSMLLLGLVEGSADPEEVALSMTVRDAREFQQEDFLRSNLTAMATGCLGLPPNAPTSILLTRLHQVGIHIRMNGMLQDRFGTFSLFTNFAEIQLRLQLAWHQRVAAQVAHRLDFQGLDWVDVCTTRRILAKLPPPLQTLFRLGLAGGSFTADFKCHWSPSGSDTCQWCGKPDSLYHRYWRCPQTEQFRLQHAPSVAPIVDKLPKALVLRGWAIQAPSWLEWVRLLASLPSDVLLPLTPFPVREWVDVFTDGSCFWQAQPCLRVAAWSAILASPCSAQWAFEFDGLLGASYLPGLVQTAYRAELYALAFTLHCAAAHRTPVRIWSDCLGVVNGFVSLFRGKARIRPNTSNADLWFWVERSLSELGDTVEVRKVAAHKDVSQALSRQEAWLYWNNGAADRAARMANQARPPEFWKIWSRYATESFQVKAWHEETVNLQMAVAEFCTHKSAISPEESPPRPTKAHRVFTKVYRDDGWDRKVPPSLSQRFSHSLATKLVTWWKKRVQSDADLLWIPIHLLYLDFQMSTGSCGPLKVRKMWVDAATRRFLAPETHRHSVRVRWFRAFLQTFWRSASIETKVEVCRPDVDIIQAFVPCVAVRWDPWTLQTVVQWLQQHLTKPCAREAHELKSLPLAKPSPTLDLGPI